MSTTPFGAIFEQPATPLQQRAPNVPQASRDHRPRPCKGSRATLANRRGHAQRLAPLPFSPDLIICEICAIRHNPPEEIVMSHLEGSHTLSAGCHPRSHHNAIETAKDSVHPMHREDFGPIGYDKRCKKCNEIVSNDQITRVTSTRTSFMRLSKPDDIAKKRFKPPRPGHYRLLSIAKRSPALFTTPLLSRARMVLLRKKPTRWLREG